MKFGVMKRMPNRQIRMTVACFHGVNCSMAEFRLAWLLAPNAPSRVRYALSLTGSPLVRTSATVALITRTRVFSEELNYFPSLCVNLRGREPHGIVDASEMPAIRRQLETLARTLVDPWTGARVIRAIHARDDVYFGPLVSRAPDFVLELALDERRQRIRLQHADGVGAVARERLLDRGIHRRVERCGRRHRAGCPGTCFQHVAIRRRSV